MYFGRSKYLDVSVYCAIFIYIYKKNFGFEKYCVKVNDEIDTGCPNVMLGEVFFTFNTDG